MVSDSKIHFHGSRFSGDRRAIAHSIAVPTGVWRTIWSTWGCCYSIAREAEPRVQLSNTSQEWFIVKHSKICSHFFMHIDFNCVSYALFYRGNMIFGRLQTLFYPVCVMLIARNWWCVIPAKLLTECLVHSILCPIVTSQMLFLHYCYVMHREQCSYFIGWEMSITHEY